MWMLRHQGHGFHFSSTTGSLNVSLGHFAGTPNKKVDGLSAMGLASVFRIVCTELDLHGFDTTPCNDTRWKSKITCFEHRGFCSTLGSTDMFGLKDAHDAAMQEAGLQKSSELLLTHLRWSYGPETLFLFENCQPQCQAPKLVDSLKVKTDSGSRVLFTSLANTTIRGILVFLGFIIQNQLSSIVNLVSHRNSDMSSRIHFLV